MTIQDNKKLVLRFYEEIVNTGNVDRIVDFISPEYIEVHENTRHSIGIEGVKQHILGVRQTYPDLSLEVTRQIAEGDLVVSQVTMRGTHKGKWLGIAPTGKCVSITAVNVDRVVGGRIVEHGGAANLFEPFLRIGAIRIVGGNSSE